MAAPANKKDQRLGLILFIFMSSGIKRPLLPYLIIDGRTNDNATIIAVKATASIRMRFRSDRTNLYSSAGSIGATLVPAGRGAVETAAGAIATDCMLLTACRIARCVACCCRTWRVFLAMT